MVQDGLCITNDFFSNKANLRHLIAAAGLIGQGKNVKMFDFLFCVTFKFERGPSKTIGHLFYATSSLVNHILAISQFKLELKSGNTKYGWKSTFFVPCKLEIWWMTSENNATSCFAPHLTAIGATKLELQSANTQSKSKLVVFCSHTTLKIDRRPWKIMGHPFYATVRFAHYFVDICKFKRELQCGNAQIGAKFVWALWPWLLTSNPDLLYGSHFCQW